MDDPVKDIAGVVRRLTQGSPAEQEDAIETYFTADAEFIHPFVRVPHFQNSRKFVHGIFRWYKIMSPTIDISINGVAFDRANLVLYLDIAQNFRIQIVPFYKAPVKLVTVLQLEYDKTQAKYYVQSQNDLYQTNEFVRFLWFGGHAVVWIWQVIAAFVCFGLTKVFWFVTWLQDPNRLGSQGWYLLSAR